MPTNQTLETVLEMLPNSMAIKSDTKAKGSNVTQEESHATFEVPDVMTIIKFAIPAIGVWLCSPLLSMIDTSAVGLLAGTAQQAALNPAVAVTDYSARCMSFLYTGATSILARQQSAAKDGSKVDNDNQHSLAISKTFMGALQMSQWVGSGLALVLLLFSPHMLRALIGNAEGMDPTILTSATRYVRIRALGMPAAATIGVAQASCLGLKDVVSPLKVIGSAAVFNLVLDLALVGQKPLWLGGAAGAAWATIFSQYLALGLFLRSLSTKPRQQQSAPITTTGSNIGATPSNDSTAAPSPTSRTTRGILSPFRVTNFKTWFTIPSSELFSKFRPFVIPVTTTQIGRCSAYVAMGHVVSSCLQTNHILAANQVVTSLFYTLIPISDSLSLTAQSFLPPLLAQPDNTPNKAKYLRKATFNLLKVALMFGAILSSFVASIPLFMNIFTTDAVVQSMVQEILPVLGICFALHGVFCGSEGILLAHQDLNFLGRMYGIFFVVVPAAFLRMKQLALAGTVNIGLATVWQAFLCYHSFRMATWVGRVVQLQRQTHQRGNLAKKDC